MPDEVLADHRQYGAGATCFALVYLFHDLLKRRGLAARLHTCDRSYGADTHAAAVAPVGRDRWLFDPGFHIVQPLPRDAETGFRAPDNPNASRIRRIADDRFECYTGHNGAWRLRFVLKDPPLSETAFKEAWAASFAADMMAYPVLNRFENGRMLYLQKSNLVVRDAAGTEMVRLSMSELPETLSRWYGIAPEIVRRALELCRRK
jgi:hypothetical protein